MTLTIDPAQRAKWLPLLKWLATDRGTGGFCRADAMDLLRCTGYQAKHVLAAAVAGGSLARVGTGRTARYYTPEHGQAIREGAAALQGAAA